MDRSADRLRRAVETFAQKQVTREQALEMFSKFDTTGALPEILDSVYGALENDKREVEANIFETGVAVKGERANWYAGPKRSDGCWAQYREKLSKNSGMKEALQDIDRESTAVVSQLANPTIRGEKKKGLVLGYVQSGKTANYAAVIAKAADSGYKLVIVLAGIHTALRQQTQRRLEKDLAVSDSFVPQGTARPRKWTLLTSVEDESELVSADGDMDAQTAKLGASVSAEDRGQIFLAVVKKNTSTLNHMINFLKNMNRVERAKLPVLIIDDESDIATPNTEAHKDSISTINRRIRTLWNNVGVGTYVAYTATPFANLLMDPNDEEELYPSDFFVAMGKPEKYFGAKEYFGSREYGITDLEGYAPTLDAVRVIPAQEVQQIEPKKKKGYTARAQMVASLADAVNWFLVATAIRRFRKGDTHSTMLVHTSMKTSSHDQVYALVAEYLSALQRSSDDEIESRLLPVFKREYLKNATSDKNVSMTWNQLVDDVLKVVRNADIIIDNSESEERLHYDPDEPATTIVVGGNTLSRGLTLEGLIVSYFARVSRTADTLLQMGRWFGYKPGYEDLVRVWLSDDVREKFTYIADIEAELREEAEFLIEKQKTPGQIGVRIRTYPGVVELTAANKMFFAKNMSQMALQGTRLQTFIFDKSPETLAHNWDVFQRAALSFKRTAGDVRRSKKDWILTDVPAREILKFLLEYSVHPRVLALQYESIGKWIEENAPEQKWNVVFVSPQSTKEYDLPGDLSISLSKRTPTIGSTDDEMDIRALIAPADLGRDLQDWSSSASIRQTIEARKERADGNGLLLLYLVDKDSSPGDSTRTTRKPLNASQHVPLFGLVPPFLSEGETSDKHYVSVVIETKPEQGE